MTTNISSLQSELLKLLNANGDITEMEYADAISTENINGEQTNLDLKGGNDLGEIVDNMLGGNVDNEKSTPATNDKNPKEIISDILLDSKDNGNKNKDDDIANIIDDIYEDNMKGGTTDTETNSTKPSSNKSNNKEEEDDSDSDSDSDGDESESSDSDDETNADDNTDADDNDNTDADDNDNDFTQPEGDGSDDDSDEDDESSESSDDSDSEDGELSSKYISIINEFKSKPVRMTGGLVGGSSNSGRVKIIPMFPYIIKQ